MKYQLWNNETKQWVKKKNGMKADFKTYGNALRGAEKRGGRLTIKPVDNKGNVASISEFTPRKELLMPKKNKKWLTVKDEAKEDFTTKIKRKYEVQSSDFKIEPFSLKTEPSTKRGAHFKEFCKVVHDLKVGESFKMTRDQSHYRLAISVIQNCIGTQYTVRKEGDEWRVGRVA